jgi:hypothetical protein
MGISIMLIALKVACIYAIAHWRDLMADRLMFERGDADSAGSTLRTLGIVVLVLAVVTIIGGAVFAYAGSVAGAINSVDYPW